MATARNNLYQLIDQLPDAAVLMAEKVLQAMVTEFPSFNEKDTAKTKLMKMLAVAPIDDEPHADDDQQAINDARNSITKGEGISLGDFKKELDL